MKNTSQGPPPTLILYAASGMTEFKRRSIAAWLRMQARNLEKHGKKYPDPFVSIYSDQ